MCTVAHYGGGLAAGDRACLDVEVRDGASLLLQTQSGSRVYKSRRLIVHAQQSVQTLHATVGAHALLVSVPDPVALQADSVYSQHSVFNLLDTSSSLVAVDWIAAGRVSRGERWRQRELRTRTELRVGGSSSPVVVDAQSSPVDMDLLLQQHHQGVSLNAFATVLLYGTQAQPVVERLQRVQRGLCAQYTAVRTTSTTRRGQ